MNRSDLEKLIDNEVSRVFSTITLKEPQVEKAEIQTIQSQPQRQIALTEDELDEIIFYGGKKPEYE